MDDDNPPPKKRSRFFSNGKSKIGNIIQPFRKQTQQPHSNSSGNPSTPGSSSTSGPSSLINPFSSRPEHPPPSNLNLVTSSSQVHPSDTAQTLKDDEGRLGDTFGGQFNSTSTEQVEKRDNDGRAQDDRDDREDHALEGLSAGDKPRKDEKRKAIYGIEALGPKASKIIPQHVHHDQASNQRGLDLQGSAFVPGLTSDTAIQARYTFTGVSANTQTTNELDQANRSPAKEPFTFTMPLPQRTANQGSTTDMQDVQQQRNTTASTATPQAITRNPGDHRISGTLPTRPLPLVNPTSLAQPYIDMDRDEQGRRIAATARNRDPLSHALYANRGGLPTLPIPVLRPTTPAHIANPDSLVPENFVTSPGRVQRARHHAQISLKRKRPDTILPPPAYVYTRSNNHNFNIFNGILLYPELVFALATALPVKDLISLYAISKDFHTIIDTRFTTVVLSQALRKAPESARTFPFRSYANLCRTDPAARIPHPNAARAARGIPRSIPSFRWLKMILHREKVIHELVTVFAEDGIPLPFRCRLALKRLWYLLDLPDNARRIGYVHNKRLMTDLDIYFSACFFTKLDMRLNDPIASEKRDGMRKMLLSQKSFTTILRVLKREIWTSKFEVLKEWVRLRYEPLDDEIGLPIFGVRPEKIGRGRLEYWGEKSTQQLGRTPQWLFRPDQLIVREAIRRGMSLERHYLQFMLYGYVRPDTLQDYAPRKYGRRIDYLKDDEYEIDDMVGGVSALGVVDEGFDDLLDLGQPRQGSVFTIVKEETSKQEKDMRKREKEFLDMCVEWWEKEQRSADF